MSQERDPSQPLVLLIGTLDKEGILSALKTAGWQYKIKRLDSSPENWASINSYFGTFNIRCALVKLTGISCELLTSLQYQDLRDRLLTNLALVPHIIFMHEELLSEEGDREGKDTNEESHIEWDTEDDLWPISIYTPSIETRKAAIEVLAARNLKVVPYRRNAELTVMASLFLADAEEGLLFRLYVPSGRLWANEIDRLLQLFRDYLSRIGHITVRLDQKRTEGGIVYAFFGPSGAGVDEGSIERSLAPQFQEFTEFLDLCVINPSLAEDILKSKNLDAREINGIMIRYAKEAKRIQVDLKHEREQKILSIRHRLESELIDVLPPSTDWNIVTALVDATVPTVPGISPALSNGGGHLNQITAAVNINYSPQIINAMNSIVASEIEGNVSLTNMDRTILDLVGRYAGNQELELTSALHELGDASVPNPSRLLAKQRLKAFLAQVGSKATDISIGLLQAYLEKKFGFS